MNELAKLQEWYVSQCNGTWEHTYGIRIESCDNPGWWIKIDLTDTALQSRSFVEIAENVSAEGFPGGPSWIHCYVTNRVWHGAGDETKLQTILHTFADWAVVEEA